MSSVAQAVPAPSSKKMLWAGRIMSGLVILFLLFDSVTKLMKTAPVMETMLKVGWPASLAFPLGVVLLICTVLYIIPQTSVLGAILLTGYLGGAVATHTRVGDPLFSHVLFPTYLGILMWAGLCARDARLRTLIPFKG